MNDPIMIISVIFLFLIRVGLPLMALIILGTLIDRWQSNQMQ